MTVDDHGHEKGVALGDRDADLIRREALAVRVDQVDRVAPPADKRRHQGGPDRWFEGGELGAQRLIDGGLAARVDDDKV